MTNGGTENEDWQMPAEAAAPRARLRDLLPAILLILIALGWAAGIGWALFARPGFDLFATVALASGPVALLLVAGLMLGNSSEGAARRRLRSAAALRVETARIETGMAEMTELMATLRAQSEVTATELVSVNEAMRADIETLGRHALLLGAAATAAREEMKTVLADLPHVEERMGQLTDLLDGAGKIVEGHAAALQTLLVALTQQGRDAEESAVSAATGLAVQLDRIEEFGRRVDPQDFAAAAERASKTAQGAATQLTRQMATLSDATARLEGRLAEATAQAERAEQDSFSRRAALLIEALHSTAIDVSRLLSHEATEAQWGAYLRGERGIFGRTALDLLTRRERAEVLALYEGDPEFRGQVNRYIHDFESMLRPVLAAQEGGPLAVTLLSSDMGKLYVALAQAIERLRG